MSEKILFPVASQFGFFDSFIPFYVGSGSQPRSGTVMRSGSVSAKAKSYSSCGSGSTTRAPTCWHYLVFARPGCPPGL
jgi:hypothetical protein